jgi:flagella basal body P-ring formation protein FlgA
VLSVFACMMFFGVNAEANLVNETSVTVSPSASESPLLETQLKMRFELELQKTIPNARIQLPSLKKVTQQPPLSQIAQLLTVRLVEDRTIGVAIFEVSGTTSEGAAIVQNLQTPYEAWLDVPVATRRIYPNTKIKEEDYAVRPVNVASGLPREYRGIILTDSRGLERVESRQTILEGHYFTRTAIQKQPDLRRGEMVKLELVSGDMSLITQGVVQESASVGDRVRVLTLKTKKELSGELKSNHVVEVKL